MTEHANGYTGVILRVNLTTKEIVKQSLDMDLASQFIGGRGLNLKYLYDELKPGTDPLGPDNKVIIGVGPCNGTLVPGSQRFTITSKSPLTGFIGDSNSGGDFGAELKYAGYDMVIIEGQSATPVYLWINDENVELRDASHLWGKTTGETRRAIGAEVGEPDACIISIGPGGENLVKIANIMAEIGRASGRAGTGAVLGSKKLKAVVVRGTRGVKVADSQALAEMARENHEAWRADVNAYDAWSKWGPPAGWARYEIGQMLCIRNFQGGNFEKNMLEEFKKYVVKHKACISCPIGCNHSYVIREGKYAGVYGEGAELSQLGDPGPRIGNDDIEVCLGISSACDDYGIDLFDMTGIIGFAMECYEKGILTKSDLDGLDLEWGNAEAAFKLIEMTAYRRGIGDTLAQGLKRAPEIIGKGSEKYAMHTKGMGLVMREPRAAKGWGLGYAVSSRGACHMRAAPNEGPAMPGTPSGPWDPSVLKMVEGYSDPTNPLLEEGKPEIIKWFEELRAFQGSMEACIFACYFGIAGTGEKPSILDVLAKFYNSVTGRNITGDEVLVIGERIVNLERAFNIREGLTRSDDSLPDRVTKEPLPDGRKVLDLEPMLDKYYGLRGWDSHSGLPGREKLAQLGLGDVADELERMSG